MSKPQKIHQPLKGGFDNILAAIAVGDKPWLKPKKKTRSRPKPSMKPDADKPQKYG